ncbi:hypothetical protein D3C78_1763890 [compost metagenome]
MQLLLLVQVGAGADQVGPLLQTLPAGAEGAMLLFGQLDDPREIPPRLCSEAQQQAGEQAQGGQDMLALQL